MCWWFRAYFPLILYKVLCFFFFFYKIYLSQSAAYHSVISISVSGTIWTEKGNPDALAKGHWVDTFKVRYWYEGPQAKKKKLPKIISTSILACPLLSVGAHSGIQKMGGSRKKKKRKAQHIKS